MKKTVSIIGKTAIHLVLFILTSCLAQEFSKTCSRFAPEYYNNFRGAKYIIDSVIRFVEFPFETYNNNERDEICVLFMFPAEYQWFKWEETTEFGKQGAAITDRISCARLNVPKFFDGSDPKRVPLSLMQIATDFDSSTDPPMDDFLSMYSQYNIVRADFSWRDIYKYGRASDGEGFRTFLRAVGKTVQYLTLNFYLNSRNSLMKDLSELKIPQLAPNLRGIHLKNIRYYDDLPTITDDPSKLLYLVFQNCNFQYLPSWFNQMSNILAFVWTSHMLRAAQFPLNNTDNWPNLEMFRVTRMFGLTELKTRFLSSSTKLRVLMLLYSEINVIATDALSHMTSLEVLEMPANRIQIIDPAVLKPLSTLRFLDLSSPDTPTGEYAQYAGAFYGNLNVYSISLGQTLDGVGVTKIRPKLEQYTLKSLSKAHFKNLQKLEVLKLSGGKNIELEDGLLDDLTNLRSLTLVNLGLQNLDKFKLLYQNCNLERLAISHNPFNGTDEWIPYEWAMNIRKLKEFDVYKTTPKKITVPFMLLSKFSNPFVDNFIFGTMNGLRPDAVGALEIYSDKCEATLFDQIFIYNKLRISTDYGVDQTCVDRFSKFRAEYDIWRKRLHDPTYERVCPLPKRRSLAQIPLGNWFVSIVLPNFMVILASYVY